MGLAAVDIGLFAALHACRHIHDQVLFVEVAQRIEQPLGLKACRDVGNVEAGGKTGVFSHFGDFLSHLLAFLLQILGFAAAVLFAARQVELFFVEGHNFFIVVTVAVVPGNARRHDRDGPLGSDSVSLG